MPLPTLPEAGPPRSALFALYLAASRRSGGIGARLIRRRRAAGTEHAERWPERLGETSVPRPEGRLAWFHAASVGEAASLLELLRRLGHDRPDLTCLVTTVTVTSAQFLEERLPGGCLHQFAPADVERWVSRFLDHWRPDLAVWTESELWPTTLALTRARGIPMVLINARISGRSYRRWRMLRGPARALLRHFDRILAQDALAGEQLAALGADSARLEVVGTLKEGAAPLPHDEAERVAIARAFARRPVWLAASTHAGEEEVAIAVHRAARRALPMLALIVAPRHPDRGDALAALLREQGVQVAQRSKGEAIDADTGVYLADTLGEMGLWYRVASVAFVGGSLVPVGGHNPFEPALLGCAILHGPHVRNFADAYARLAAAGAAAQVGSEAELAETLISVLAPERAAAMAAAGWEACSDGAEVTDTVLEVLGGYLDRAT